MQTIRVIIVDDHRLLREMLAHVLGAEQDIVVPGVASSADAAVALAGRLQPDIVLLDVEMPGNQPALTVRRLAAAAPRARVIILSVYDDPRLIRDLLDTGSRGYLHKGVSRAELLTAIRTLCGDDDRRVMVSAPRSALTAAHAPSALSGREKEVLALVAKAMSNRQIAGTLAITEGTVKRHLRNIFRKLDAVSRIDAVNKANSAALIAPRAFPGDPPRADPAPAPRSAAAGPAHQVVSPGVGPPGSRRDRPARAR
jgi:two-component system, NarL family, nitrate/nitrite response regulator NarL